MTQIKEAPQQKKPAPVQPSEKFADRSRAVSGGAGTTQQEKRNENSKNKNESGRSVEETPDFSIGFSG